MSQDIRVFKLISGEEIVAKVEETTDPEYEGCHKISDPRLIQPMNTQSGMQLGFQVWIFSVDPAKAMPLAYGIVMIEQPNPPQGLTDAFLQAVSGIQLST